MTLRSKDDKRLLSCRFTTKTAKVYRKARLRYHHPVKDEDYDEEYEDYAEEGSERILEIHERAETSDDAKRIAEQRLIEANRKEITASITLKGDKNSIFGSTGLVGSFKNSFYKNSFLISILYEFSLKECSNTFIN